MQQWLRSKRASQVAVPGWSVSQALGEGLGVDLVQVWVLKRYMQWGLLLLLPVHLKGGSLPPVFYSKGDQNQPETSACSLTPLGSPGKSAGCRSQQDGGGGGQRKQLGKGKEYCGVAWGPGQGFGCPI